MNQNSAPVDVTNILREIGSACLHISEVLRERIAEVSTGKIDNQCRTPHLATCLTEFLEILGCLGSYSLIQKSIDEQACTHFRKQNLDGEDYPPCDPRSSLYESIPNIGRNRDITYLADRKTKHNEKRIRINWAVYEDEKLLRSIRRWAHLNELEISRHAVKALEGRRSLAQVRCRFRTMLSNGRVRYQTVHVDSSKGKRWIVSSNIEPIIRKRSNWTKEEQRIIMGVLHEFNELNDEEIVNKMYQRLSGKRTWIQVRRHLNYLKSSGKVQ